MSKSTIKIIHFNLNEDGYISNLTIYLKIFVKQIFAMDIISPKQSDCKVLFLNDVNIPWGQWMNYRVRLVR